MESWKEVYHGIIPIGNYTAEIKAGEEKGVEVILESKYNLIKINFGALYATRILDEGMVLQEFYNESELSQYSKGKFENTIYKIEDGEFEEFSKKISGTTYYDYMKFNHYMIVTINYFIEVISPWEPEIEVACK